MDLIRLNEIINVEPQTNNSGVILRTGRSLAGGSVG